MTNPVVSALEGRYRIERELGAGGMATVYLAHDVRHDRKVALKILHPHLSAAIGPERFLQEIKTTAGLQHPGILALFDSGQIGDTVFYVMPFVEGESLRDRLNREKQLPIDEAIRITKEVAAALDYAHRKGIVHRDIKPENILLNRLNDGQALVTDFGIALAPSSVNETRLTQTGLSLGTPVYMSPEQAMGERLLDARTDVYALGCVLYEMLTGQPPFTGSTSQAIVAKVLTTEPARLSAFRKTIPPGVEAAVLQALEKIPADRFGSPNDFVCALLDPLFRRVTDTVAPPYASATQSRSAKPARSIQILPWAIAAMAVAAVLFVLWRERTTAPARTAPAPILAEINLTGAGLRSDGNDDMSISPDGSKLALVVVRDDNASLAVRTLDSLTTTDLANTRNASYPFWSHDSRVIGFFTADALKTIDSISGEVHELCKVVRGIGGTWNANGVILFGGEGLDLQQTTSQGGTCRPVTAKSGASRGRPYFFPDGKHFIVTRSGQVSIASLDSLVFNRLKDLKENPTDRGGAQAALAPPDILLFKPFGQDNLQGQRIDISRGELVGDPIEILPRVGSPNGHLSVTASSGVLVVSRQRQGQVVRASGRGPQGQPSDGQGLGRRGAGSRAGRGLGNTFVMDRESGDGLYAGQTDGSGTGWGGTALSRDGERVALGGWNIKMRVLNTDETSHVAGYEEFGKQGCRSPRWSPDDDRLAYVQNQNAADGGTKISVATVVIRSRVISDLFTAPSDARQIHLTDWSHDGNRLAYELLSAGNPNRELREFNISTKEHNRMINDSVDVTELRYGPADAWIAYQSTGPEGPNVFIRRYPVSSDPPFHVSGGQYPRWKADGTELYYIATDDSIMAVPIQLGKPNPIGTSRTIFGPDVIAGRRISGFDVAPDGKRFLFR